MRITKVNKRTLTCAILYGVMALSCLSPAYAQQQKTRPKVEVKVALGYSNFGDELEYPHFVAGGSLRVYFAKRWSVEPELLYMRGSSSDHDIVPSLNIAYDLVDPTKKNTVPYLVLGLGFLYHWDGSRGSVNWSSGSFGIGVKTFVNDRVSLFADFRAGENPTVRATFGVGYVIGGREKN